MEIDKLDQLIEITREPNVDTKLVEVSANFLVALTPVQLLTLPIAVPVNLAATAEARSGVRRMVFEHYALPVTELMSA